MSDEGLDFDLSDALPPLEREWLLLGGMRQLISIAQRTQARMRMVFRCFSNWLLN